VSQVFDTIYIHAGLPKTGSTYLQNGLQALSVAGKLKHVGYPVLTEEKEFSNIGSGNGVIISNVILKPESEEVVRRQLDTLVTQLVKAADPAATPDLLISSENFFFATDEGFAILKETLLRHCQKVKLIIAIRPLREWTYSVYMQRVKGHGFAEDYDAAWLMEYCSTFDRCFASLERRGVETIAFPYQEKDLLRTFLGLIGEDEALAKQVPDIKVNRSLSYEELELVRRVNSYFNNEALSRMISEDFIRNWPDVVSAAFPPDREPQYQQFAEGFSTQLAHLRSPLLMRVKEILFAAAATPPATNGAGADAGRDLFDVVLRNLRKLLDPSLKDAAVYGVMRKYVTNMDRTDDFFDPIHYLLMYPDVVKPGINPWAHFQDHGRREGRKSAFVKRGVK
jgi:hypothetical protein